MPHYIDKDALVSEIEKRLKEYQELGDAYYIPAKRELKEILSFISTLEVVDPYEQCVQYDSIKAGIKAHAETYSFNIESELFNQLTLEQQKLWRKEIEQACISGGEMGVELARDTRYKENLKVKEVDLEDLEDAASSFAKKDSEGVDNLANFYYIVADKARIFKAGAKWQKEHLMKDAIEAEVRKRIT